MPTDFTVINEKINPEQPAELWLKYLLICRLYGEKCPPGENSLERSKIRGMKDVAETYKPAINIPLTNEYGTEEKHFMRYYENVSTEHDLVKNCNINHVVQHMKSEGKPDEPGLLLRLLVKKAALERFKAALQQDKKPPENLSGQLKQEIERLKTKRDELKALCLED